MALLPLHSLAMTRVKLSQVLLSLLSTPSVAILIFILSLATLRHDSDLL